MYHPEGYLYNLLPINITHPSVTIVLQEKGTLCTVQRISCDVKLSDTETPLYSLISDANAHNHYK